jgi:hypothetical protein
VQHLGLDYVPVIKGVRSKEDKTKWIKKSWICCDGDTYCIFGNLPDNVTRADWCNALGIDSRLVTQLDQLRNALWPRLGALLSTQAVMYYMAQRFGFPVVEYAEMIDDVALGTWLHSLLFSPVWPRMPFKRAYLILVPVNLPDTIVVDATGHLLSILIPEQSSTFRRDIAAAFAAAYAPLTFPAQYLRFEGMVNIGADKGVVFKAEFIDDRSRTDLQQSAIEAPTAQDEWPRDARRQAFNAVPLEAYKAFVHASTRKGRVGWGIDALIIRDCIGAQPHETGVALQLAPGWFAVVTGHTLFVRPCHAQDRGNGTLLEARVATSLLAEPKGGVNQREARKQRSLQNQKLRRKSASLNGAQCS